MANFDFALRSTGCVAAAVLLMLPMSGVLAQDADSVTVQQLQQALAERDAIIVDLLNRVRALEQDRSASASGARTAIAAPASAATRQPGPEDEGDFTIDELAAERALERGLIQEGVRLLGPGQFEVEPSFAFSHRNGMYPAALMSGDSSVVGEISRTYDVHERRTNLRVGLPWASQLEIGIPYVIVDRKIEIGVDGTVESSMEASGSGPGDATIGFSKVLAAERGARPNLIGRLVWLSGSGDERDGVIALGGGYSGFGGRLSAYWRRDPVVLLLGGGYTRYDAGSALKPGDSLDFSVGLGLALSPETALVFSLNQTLADEFERDGVKLPGTDRLASTLDFSVSTTLGRRLFLRGYTAAGLTDESPDYAFGLSLSSRFDRR